MSEILEVLIEGLIGDGSFASCPPRTYTNLIILEGFCEPIVIIAKIFVGF